VKHLFGQIFTTGRLLALTDGVYAIVITLLVLDLHVPETQQLNETSLVTDLQGQFPNFIAYLISFFVLAFLWMRHHWILGPVEKCNFKTFWLNFLHLLFVTLIPYTASLIGHYEGDTIAVIFFFASIGLATLSLIFLHRHVVTKTEWHSKDVTKEWTSPAWQVMYPMLLLSLGSILISFINVNAALAFWLILPVWLSFFYINSR
jgi:uncharacterized membrane protein